MKRATAFLLSLTVIWLQVMAAAQTLSASVAPTEQCPCCVAKKSCCCVEESAPAAAPLPATPASANASIDLTAVLAKVIAWTLPATAPAIVSSSDRAFALSSAVPLFQRNCALLI
jgi:hypothetical protein